MLIQIQNRVKQLLEAHEWFDGLTVLTEEKGTIAHGIEKAVATASGVVPVVITPFGQPDADGHRQRYKMQLAISVALIQNAALGGTKAAADGVAPVIQALQGQWSGVGSENVGPQSGNLFKLQGWGLDPDAAPLTAYEIRFTVSINLQLDQLPNSAA